MQTTSTGRAEPVVEESSIQDDTWTVCDIADDSFKKRLKNKMRYVPRSLRLALLVAVFLHFFATAMVPSESMKSTLQINDFVVYQRTDHVERGDIVLFTHPFTNEEYVKRVIGLPGETVEIKDGVVSIDGKPIDENYLYEPFEDAFEPYTIAPNNYFVMGDNRNYSEDSRIFGAIKASSVRGKAVFILLPFHRIGTI